MRASLPAWSRRPSTTGTTRTGRSRRRRFTWSSRRPRRRSRPSTAAGTPWVYHSPGWARRNVVGQAGDLPHGEKRLLVLGFVVLLLFLVRFGLGLFLRL